MAVKVALLPLLVPKDAWQGNCIQKVVREAVRLVHLHSEEVDNTHPQEVDELDSTVVQDMERKDSYLR